MKDYFGPQDFKGIWDASGKIIYTKPPRKSWQGMPVGTGRTGAMVWVPGGLELQIGHTDCWAADGGLPSLLRINIEISGDPFANSNTFLQELDLREGLVRLKASTAEGEVGVEVRAHPELDVIAVEITDMRKLPGKVNVIPYCWRNRPAPSMHDNMVMFTERNDDSSFSALNRQSGVYKEFPDPLAGLCYGTAVALDDCGNIRIKSQAISELEPSRVKQIFICADVVKGEKDELINILAYKMKTALGINANEFKNSHSAWWRNFWEKSYFELSPQSKLQPARAVWYMNRYFAACTMKGKYPPKFNGSVFLFDYDRRAWGGCYWFQNTRLQYCPLYKTGDIQYLMQFFDLYYNSLEYHKERVKSIYGHKGAIFIETMNYWGAARERDAQEGKGITNKYIRCHFSGSLELIMMMQEYYRYTRDRAFAMEKMLPVAEEVLTFFFNHFPVVNGKLFLGKSSALETWWEADNPADQIAGLQAVLPAILIIAEELGYSKKAIEDWKVYCSQLPALPRGKMQVVDRMWQDPLPGNDLLPALNVHHKKKENHEEAELYALWPFNLFGINMPDYETALSTYQNRFNKEPGWGWSQTAVWAARLGLGEEAAQLLLKQFNYGAAFPGGMMASPGERLPGRQDIANCPYFDTTGVMATAVNEMLIQDYTGEIKILPAWPEDEEVSFKLYLPEERIIEHNYQPK